MVQQNMVNETESKERLLSRFLFFIKGLVYPCGSGSYYRAASEKRLLWGIVFFFFFALVITVVATFRVSFALYQLGGEIKGAYEREEFPTIVIRDGIAQVDGPQTLVFEDRRNIFAIDTTGDMDEIDTRSYSQGILLTRTELHVVSDEGYEVMSLDDLNKSFGNPIVLDKDQALELWKTASLWLMVLASVGILIWNSFIRFAYIVVLGLVVWGIVSIIRKGVNFSPILIVGILANVPVIYLRFILKQLNVNFFSLYTILLVAVWAFALRAVFKTSNVEEMAALVDIVRE
ncbi:MAG: DUF1189 domain-containing protein [Deltaproteobacteria bacterium]|nr:DUF1189 domain-containing protein [Deltaproteobacteria bacterium]